MFGKQVWCQERRRDPFCGLNSLANSDASLSRRRINFPLPRRTITVAKPRPQSCTISNERSVSRRCLRERGLAETQIARQNTSSRLRPSPAAVPFPLTLRFAHIFSAVTSKTRRLTTKGRHTVDRASWSSHTDLAPPPTQPTVRNTARRADTPSAGAFMPRSRCPIKSRPGGQRRSGF